MFKGACRVVGLLLLFLLVPGCVIGNRPSFASTGSVLDGKTFYLDGAGNFGFGKESVPRGLARAGYTGNVEHFIWTSYMGPLVDQRYLSHNRRQARELARRIENYHRQHPGREVNVIALSAGTGVAIFALEELPPSIQVDKVVLLSSSLSAGYDLTAALRRVKDGLYVFWSPQDPILRRVVTIIGTVDGASFGSRAAGTHGIVLPAGAEKETQTLYRKVFNIPWQPGETGSSVGSVMTLRHAETTREAFIRELVAPLILEESRPAATALGADTESVKEAAPATQPASAPPTPASSESRNPALPQSSLRDGAG